MVKKLGTLLGTVAVAGVALQFSTVNVHADKVTVGSVTSDADIWRHIAKSPAAKKADLQIKVKEFTDGATLNRATASGQVDVNAFQSYSYFLAFNKQTTTSKLAALGTTYIEPLGIYSDQYKKVDEIPDGATIAIARDNADAARGLRLLANAGLITLKSDFSALSGISDIADNPHHFDFKEIDDTTGVSLLKNDKSVAAVLISNSVSQAGGLNVLKDSIYHESINTSTKDNINILATRQSQANNKTYKKLVKLYHNASEQKWVTDKYHGTKVEVKKSLSYLEGK
ncbi:MetQ/NlpA family ABC transporter substrate-binding protein [Weissella confusa]|uniref:MetQ/NlpA family ABC transporter substrate-binding protein n=1 Tax=Weissella confusa TaxID=1583 RepID=UPI0018F2385B|nr:MetQ/NlpA family ABC transporter substrate-binding protein [Weissella confusa]MBJ7617853.1 ABC transporter substrate-binding protein [Weissella confusa]MBJ7623849.1 ABC transporter substrate-binding protein [Weissella confusa]MBJ7651091.1 ABC transporter substrate-binding protein [Weissella confusa]MBJ7664836.1 ABC transporter substrate-binding protein [Weissella confusa]MBJ7675357.1 ABC transporter substrate-binding protein [Weissella confusa]